MSSRRRWRAAGGRASVERVASRAVRNLSPWAYWQLRSAAATAPAPPLEDPAELERWRDEARTQLLRMLGPPPPRVPLALEERQVRTAPGLTAHEVVLDVEAGMSMPAHVLVPDGRREPGPAVVAIPGHGLDKDAVCGLDASSPAGAYGRQLAARGMVVLAPDLRGFGERADRMLTLPTEPPFEAEVVADHFSCDWNLVCALMAGTTPLAQNLWDLQRAVDVLAEHPLVEPGRIGVAGWSYGGTLALFLAAIDARVQATLVSGFFSSWQAAHRVPWNMCGSQVLPGMLGNLEHLHLAALVLPRTVCIESGEDDELFPVAEAVRNVETLRAIARRLGFADTVIDHHVVPGGHRWHGGRSVERLLDALADPG